MPLNSHHDFIPPQLERYITSLMANNIKLHISDLEQPTGQSKDIAVHLKRCYSPDDVFDILGQLCTTEGFLESLDIIIHYLLQFEEIDAAAIWLLNEDKLELLIQDSREQGLLGVLNQPFHIKAFKSKILKEVITNHSLTNTDVVRINHEHREDVSRISEVLCIPLVHFGEAQGVLTLYTKHAQTDLNHLSWFKMSVPMIATLLYKHKLILTATSKERSLSLLLKKTEILVRAQSEEELLREAGEMAMEILSIESGFFLMLSDKGWRVSSPFGLLQDSQDSSWFAEVERFIQTPSFVEQPKSITIIRPEKHLPGLGAKILVYPLITHSGIVGQLWLGNFDEKLYEQNQEILAALVRGVGVALETIRQREQLEMLAMTDPLTGIFNRQGFEKRIREEMAAAMRRRSSFLFLILDLDGFKLINDTKGHPVGDYVLKKIAHVLKKSVRVQDIVARTGGDEFAIVLTDITLNHEALSIIERIQKEISTSHLGLGVSIGVAEFPHEASSYDMLYKIADQRLYVGKGTGKGKIIMK